MALKTMELEKMNRDLDEIFKETHAMSLANPNVLKLHVLRALQPPRSAAPRREGGELEWLVRVSAYLEVPRHDPHWRHFLSRSGAVWLSREQAGSTIP